MSSAVPRANVAAAANSRAAPPTVWGEIWAFLSSLKLLLFTLCIGAVPLVVGTFFVQKPLGQFDAEQEIERLGPELYALLETFNIFNIYHSWYFQLILLMIAVNNICCTIDRFFIKMKRLTSKAVGVIIVHIGVNTVLAGAFYSSRAGVEGFMQVFENAPPKNVMLNFFKEEEMALPFSVQLDDFRLVKWDEADERVFLVDLQARETLQVVQLDHTQPYPQVIRRGSQDYFSKIADTLRGGPREAIRIDEHYPDATFRMGATPTGNPDDPWMLKLATRTPEEVGSGYLTANDGNRLTIVPRQLTAAYVRAETPEHFTYALAPHAAAGHAGPTLIARDNETRMETAYAVEDGDVIELPDDSGVVTVLQFAEDFAHRDRPGDARMTGRPAKPALRISLQDEDGERTGWLLANFEGSVLRNDWMTLRFLTRSETAGGARELDFVSGPAGERKLVLREGGCVVDVADAPAGSTYTIDELGVTLDVVEYVDGARRGVEAVKLSDEPGDPAVKVTLVEEGEATFSEWIPAASAADVPDSTLRFVFDREFGIKEFQSDLSIYKDGRKIIDKHEIIVNRYLAVDGYHIYQASYDEENLRWSGLSIKRDPGLKITYTGFGFMFAGVFFLFYIRPILEARRTGRPLFSGNGAKWRGHPPRCRPGRHSDTLGVAVARRPRPPGGRRPCKRS